MIHQYLCSYAESQQKSPTDLITHKSSIKICGQHIQIQIFNKNPQLICLVMDHLFRFIINVFIDLLLRFAVNFFIDRSWTRICNWSCNLQIFFNNPWLIWVLTAPIQKSTIVKVSHQSSLQSVLSLIIYKSFTRITHASSHI